MGMYFTSCAYPMSDPLKSESPHQAPNSWVPPKGAASVAGRGRVMDTAVEVVLPPADSRGSARGEGTGSGSLQKELALTVRESRYQGGRKRSMFAVPRPGLRS